MSMMSDRGLDFVARHEGFVSQAYRDPVGVWTIGTGFTNASRTAVAALGRIGPGKTISREQNRDLLRRAFADEYFPPVARRFPGARQHELDAAGSFVFNVGAGGLKWRWADSLAARRVVEAAARVRVTATTAGGRKLRGLVRRRDEEGDLMESGDYGYAGHPTFPPAGAPVREAKSDPVLAEYQEHLRDMGLYEGQVDGLRGPKTRAAVEAFQRQHPQLVVDGILGRATMAQIDRVVDLRRRAASQPARAGAGGAGAGAAGGAASEAPGAAVDPSAVAEAALGWGVVVGIAAFLVVAGWLAWRYRDELRLALRWRS